MFDVGDDGAGFRALIDRVREAPPAMKALGAALAVVLVATFVLRGSVGSGDDLHVVEGDLVPPAATEATSTARVVVHVVGAVRTPGLYVLPEGSRVSDAVEAAGGMLGNAADEAVNLARVLNDGEQVRIPTTDEASATIGAAGSTAPGAPQKVNINTATAADLEMLPGIGPATAQKIVDDRARNGPFSAPEDIMRVPGIGPKKYDALKDLITTG